jgi:uncharacterized protein YbjT (DUF2867 family)
VPDPKGSVTMKTIAISTPTGNVGSKLVALLREHARTHDLELVLLARKPEAIADAAGPRVRIECGRLEDPEFLVRATRGVDALYWATPNSFPPELTIRAGYRRFAESAAAAISTNRIRHTVQLSGFAHVDDGGGERSLFGGLADTEALLGEAVERLVRENPRESFGITHLRAGFFFENLLGQLNYLRERGRVFLPVNRGRRIPMVASHDVARRAFEILVGDAPRGRAFTAALGPEDLSFAEAARRITQGLGREVRIHRLPRCLIRQRMLKIGRDPRPTEALMLAFGAINEGKLAANPPRDAQSTTPTAMERWAEDVLKPLVYSDEGAVCPARVQYEAS